MFIRRPENASSRTDDTDERILRCIDAYETTDEENLIEKNRGIIVFDVLERNREGGILLEIKERDLLQYDEVIPRTVLARLKKILKAKVKS